MKRKIIIIGLVSLCCLSCFAQVTIEDCYSKAQANYPLIKQYNLVRKTREYNLSNASKGYLPQIMFSSKATYQSEVTHIPISMPGVRGLSKDQYGAALDVNQTIWDGGAIESQKEGIRSVAEVDKMNIEVDIYAINERVNQLYFGILLFEAKVAQNQTLRDELQRNHEKVLSYIKNGIANQADLDAIKVEQLKALQAQSQLSHTKKAYLDMLSTLVGEKFADDVILVKPAITRPTNLLVQRPELQLFDAQIKVLEAKRHEIDASLMPKLGAFVTGGYGKPGLNMLSNNFSGYYIAGLRLSWNIGNLYTNKNSKRIIQTHIYSVENQRQTFIFNTNMDVSRKENDIEKCFDQLKYDNEIIVLRNSVKKASESKVANGTLSVIDLMRDVSAEDMARQDKILHEIELLLSIYNLKFVTNN